MYAILLFFIVIYILYYFTKNADSREYFKGDGKSEPHYEPVPKVIWTFWNEDTLPDVVSLCIQTWRKFNPDYVINVLSPNNVNQFIDVDLKAIKWNDSPARESDIVRLLVIEKYGGVWCDATVMMTKPLEIDSRYLFTSYYFGGITNNFDHPIVESWFFSSVPNNPFITKWKNAFFKLDEFDTVADAVKYMKDQGVDFQKMHSHEYLFVYIAAAYVMQKQMTDAEIKKTMLFKKAEDGPWKYSEKNGWDVDKSLDDLCNGNNVTDMIKFRSNERNALLKNADLKDCVFSKAL
jgi:hypothetical protein